MAGAAEMGRLTYAEIGRRERHTRRGECRRVCSQTEGGRRGGNRRRRADPGGEPDRSRSYRRISALLPPVRAWRRQAVLCRRPATTPHYCQRSRWRGRGSADVCPSLSVLSARLRCNMEALRVTGPSWDLPVRASPIILSMRCALPCWIRIAPFGRLEVETPRPPS